MLARNSKEWLVPWPPRLAAQAVSTQEEPAGNEPIAPEGVEEILGSVQMLKWEVQRKDFNKKNKK